MLTESDLHDAQTEFFIDRQPTSLTLYRKEWIDDGAGGKFKAAEPEQYIQTVRLVGQRRPPIRIVDGKEVQIDLFVVGTREFDVRIGDTFLSNGSRYEIVNVQDQPEWRVIGEAVRRGVQ